MLTEEQMNRVIRCLYGSEKPEKVVKRVSDLLVPLHISEFYGSDIADLLSSLPNDDYLDYKIEKAWCGDQLLLSVCVYLDGDPAWYWMFQIEDGDSVCHYWIGLEDMELMDHKLSGHPLAHFRLRRDLEHDLPEGERYASLGSGYTNDRDAIWLGYLDDDNVLWLYDNCTMKEATYADFEEVSDG